MSLLHLHLHLWPHLCLLVDGPLSTSDPFPSGFWKCVAVFQLLLSSFGALQREICCNSHEHDRNSQRSKSWNIWEICTVESPLQVDSLNSTASNSASNYTWMVGVLMVELIPVLHFTVWRAKVKVRRDAWVTLHTQFRFSFVHIVQGKQRPKEFHYSQLSYFLLSFKI